MFFLVTLLTIQVIDMRLGKMTVEENIVTGNYNPLLGNCI